MEIITIPTEQKTIKRNEFLNFTADKIIISNNVEQIERNAFCNCLNLSNKEK